MNIKHFNNGNDFYIFSTNLSLLEKLNTYEKDKSYYLDKCIDFINNASTKFIKDNTTQLKLLKSIELSNNEICLYINFKGQVIDNFLPITNDDLKSFNIYNIAPYNAYAIAIYNKNENNKPIGYPKGYILLDKLKQIFDKRLYRVGLCSDIHYNDATAGDNDPSTFTDDGSEFYADSINCLTYYQNKEEVDFIAVAGDVGTDSINHDRNFKLLMDNYSPTTPLYSCYGNHDYCAANKDPYEIIEDSGTGLGNIGRREYWNTIMVPNESKYELHHLDNDIDSKGYASYWFEVPIEGTNKSDIYIFLSVDYFVSNENIENTMGWGPSLAQHIISYNDDDFINEVFEYVYNNDIDAINNRSENSKQYDYQFYNCEALIWFKNILEQHPNKRIFIFTHQFFAHKTGNNNSGSYYCYAGDNWRISRADNGHGAYCLSGIQFEFLNKLNNLYPNTIWFTGHSHYKWEWQHIDTDINISNIEYAYVDPTSEEYEINQNKRYLRSSNNEVINRNTGYNIHLPSTCRPIPEYSEGYSISGESSQGAIMDIYENYVDIRGIIFKESSVSHNNEYEDILDEHIYIDTTKSGYDGTQEISSDDEYNIIVKFTKPAQRFYIDYLSISPNAKNHVIVNNIKVIDGYGSDVTNILKLYSNPKIGLYGTDGLYHLGECNVNIINNGLELPVSSSFNAYTFPMTLYINMKLDCTSKYYSEDYINKYLPIAQYRIPIKAN